MCSTNQRRLSGYRSGELYRLSSPLPASGSATRSAPTARPATVKLLFKRGAPDGKGCIPLAQFDIDSHAPSAFFRGDE
jgi:hypothetical protein